LELCFFCVGLLGACFFASCPFSGSGSEINQPALCCQCVMLVCWLFFNFTTSFDFGCCSLAREMSFANHYLPYFRLWLITCPLSALLPFQSLFGNQTLSPTLFSGVLRALCPLFWVFLFSSFLLFSFFVWEAGVSLSSMLCWFIPGVAVGIPRAAYLLTCWSLSRKQVWSQHLTVWGPSCFLSVRWCGEVLYWLKVQGVRFLILLGSFLLPSVVPAS
jgi:hypothetical protein